jgi:hypothetical protein
MSDVQENIVLSEPALIDITLYRGDSGNFRINMTDPDGNPMDISGSEWDGDIRLKPDDPEPITSFEFVDVPGVPSSVDVLLPAEKSALINKKCVYDIERRSGNEVTTLMHGTIVVTQDVSRS